jgi:hypothetical protein
MTTFGEEIKEPTSLKLEKLDSLSIEMLVFEKNNLARSVTQQHEPEMTDDFIMID